MKRTIVVDNDDLVVDIPDTIGLWPDMVKWEETPFRSSDDITLLSFGFHFTSDGTSLYAKISGDDWLVDCSKSVPTWTKNGTPVGPFSYDDVVNMFTTVKKEGV